MNRSILRIVGCRRRAHTLQRMFVLAALAVYGVFGAAGGFAYAAESNSSIECRTSLALARKNFGEFRERPFSALSSTTVNYTSVASGCGSAASDAGTEFSSTTTERGRDRAVTYIDIQGEALWQDMAGGQGERLVALGTLAGCPLGTSREFGLKVQAQFGRLVPASTASPTEVWNNVERLIAEDTYLSAVCRPPKPL